MPKLATFTIPEWKNWNYELKFPILLVSSPILYIHIFKKEKSVQVVPCALLAVLIHPSTSHQIINRIAWAFCVYLEAVSVLPQLRVMQNTKVKNLGILHIVIMLFIFCIRVLGILHIVIMFSMSWWQIVEPFTAHYVFALGVARFLSCAHWVLQVWNPNSFMDIFNFAGNWIKIIIIIRYLIMNLPYDYSLMGDCMLL